MFLPLLLTLLGGNELPPTPCVDVSYTIRADSAVVRGGKLAVAGRVTNHRKEVIAIVPSALPGSWSAMQSTRLRGFSAFDQIRRRAVVNRGVDDGFDHFGRRRAE